MFKYRRPPLFQSLPLFLDLKSSWKTVKPYSTTAQDELRKLAKLDNLDKVDPKIVSELIHQHTRELENQKELETLRLLRRNDTTEQQEKWRRFRSPLIWFFVMSSSVYLSWHLLWGFQYRQYRERQLRDQMQSLDYKLETLLKEKNAKSWYSKLWR